MGNVGHVAHIHNRALTPLSGTTAAAGNTALVTPPAGMRLRVSYLSYNPSGAVGAAFRFGAAGGLFLYNDLAIGGGVVAKDFGDDRCVLGAVDEALYLNLSGAVSTNWNIFYEVVNP